MRELFLKAYGIPYFTTASSMAFFISAATAGNDEKAGLFAATVFFFICFLSGTYGIAINILYKHHEKFITNCHKSTTGRFLSLSLYSANIPAFVGALASMIFDQLISNVFVKIIFFALTVLWVWLTSKVLNEMIKSDFEKEELEEKIKHPEHSSE